MRCAAADFTNAVVGTPEHTAIQVTSNEILRQSIIDSTYRALVVCAVTQVVDTGGNHVPKEAIITLDELCGAGTGHS